MDALNDSIRLPAAALEFFLWVSRIQTTQGIKVANSISRTKVSLRMRPSLSALFIASSIAGPSLVCATDAKAQSEIVVTAERRSVDIQKAPIAITSLSAESLDKSFANTITSLNSTVPGLQATKTAGFENLVTIRGIGSGTPENSFTTSPGVSVFIDGVYIANTISLDQSFFDLKSIEVLRGPQGALYGQSSIGGAMNINTNQPVLEKFQALGDFTIGTYSLLRERAAVNVPIGDKWAVRLSGQKFDQDGFTKNNFNGQELDDVNEGSLKGAVLFQPTDSFKAILTGNYYTANQNGDAQKNVIGPATDPRRLNQDYWQEFQLETKLVNLNIKWQLPDFSIRSVTGFEGLSHSQMNDSDRSTFATVGGYDHIAAWKTNTDTYTQEINLISNPGGKFDWVLGAFGLFSESNQFVVEYGGGFTNTPPPRTYPDDVVTAFTPGLNYGNNTDGLRRSYALFGQGAYHVTDDFRITAGGRWNQDYFKADSLTGSAFSLGRTVLSYQEDNPTWRLVGEYDLTADNNIYASVSRGYKPGGVNGTFGQLIIPAEFEAETNDAFEIGSKNWFFDRTLRVNVAAFYYKHKNFQFIETDPIPFVSGINNVPEIEDIGLEIEAQYVSPDKKLVIGGNLTLQHGEVTESFFTLNSQLVQALEGTAIQSFGNGVGPCAFFASYGSPACWAAVLATAQDVKGNSPPAAPEVSGSINASYRFDSALGSFIPRVEVVYRGVQSARIFNTAADKVDAYTVVNAGLEFLPSSNEKFRFKVTGTNLFDEDGVNSRFIDPYGTFQTSDQYIPPRQILATVAFKY